MTSRSAARGAWAKGWVLARLLVAVTGTPLAITACDEAGPGRERHPDWMIHSKVVFLSEDLSNERAPLPLARFRMLFPYIAGDLYGAPTTGELLDTRVAADYGLDIDLNRSEKALLASLEPTQFSLPYLSIEPPEARIARLAPMAIEADGIEPVGRVDWVDPDSKQRLLLVYADRAARITGTGVAGGRPLRYDILFATAGYAWIARQTHPEGDIYSVTSKPVRLVVAVTPAFNRPTPALPARTDIPVH